MPQDFVKVAQTGDLSPGQMKLVEIGDERILLCNVEGEYHAVDGRMHPRLRPPLRGGAER